MFDIEEDLEQKVAVRTQKLAHNLNNSRIAISKAAAVLNDGLDDDDEDEEDFQSAAKAKKGNMRDNSDSRSKANLSKSKDRSAQ